MTTTVTSNRRPSLLSAVLVVSAAMLVAACGGEAGSAESTTAAADGTRRSDRDDVAPSASERSRASAVDDVDQAATTNTETDTSTGTNTDTDTNGTATDTNTDTGTNDNGTNTETTDTETTDTGTNSTETATSTTNGETATTIADEPAQPPPPPAECTAFVGRTQTDVRFAPVPGAPVGSLTYEASWLGRHGVGSATNTTSPIRILAAIAEGVEVRSIAATGSTSEGTECDTQVAPGAIGELTIEFDGVCQGGTPGGPTIVPVDAQTAGTAGYSACATPGSPVVLEDLIADVLADLFGRELAVNPFELHVSVTGELPPGGDIVDAHHPRIDDIDDIDVIVDVDIAELEIDPGIDAPSVPSVDIPSVLDQPILVEPPKGPGSLLPPPSLLEDAGLAEASLPGQGAPAGGDRP